MELPGSPYTFLCHHQGRAKCSVRLRLCPDDALIYGSPCSYCGLSGPPRPSVHPECNGLRGPSEESVSPVSMGEQKSLCHIYDV